RRRSGDRALRTRCFPGPPGSTRGRGDAGIGAPHGEPPGALARPAFAAVGIYLVVTPPPRYGRDHPGITASPVRLAPSLRSVPDLSCLSSDGAESAGALKVESDGPGS